MLLPKLVFPINGGAVYLASIRRSLCQRQAHPDVVGMMGWACMCLLWAVRGTSVRGHRRYWSDYSSIMGLTFSMGGCLQSCHCSLRWRWERDGLWYGMRGDGENEPRQMSWLVFGDAPPPLANVVGLPMSYHRSYADVELSSSWVVCYAGVGYRGGQLDGHE